MRMRAATLLSASGNLASEAVQQKIKIKQDMGKHEDDEDDEILSKR
jgi:hypothetical protein